MPETLTIEVLEKEGSQGPEATATAAAPTAPPRTEPPKPGGIPATSAIDQVSGVAGAAAGGDVGGAAAQTIRGAASSLGAAGTAALGFTAAVGVAAVGIRTFSATVQRQVDQLAGFSIDAARAQAETSLQRELSLIRRGERIGGGVARAERLRRRFEQETFDIQTGIYDVLLKLLAAFEPFLETTADGLNVIGETLASPTGIRGLLRGFGGIYGQALVHLVDLAEARAEAEEDAENDRMLELLMGHAMRARLGEPGVSGAMAAAAAAAAAGAF